MKTHAPALILSALLPAAALAQGQKTAKPAPSGKAVITPEAKPAPSADVMLEAADKDMGSLPGPIAQFADCTDAVDLMKKDLSALFLRQPPKGPILPNMNQDLLVIKQNRLSLQRNVCTGMMKDINTRINDISINLGRVEPPDHPGVAPRRAKLNALLEQYNSSVVKMGMAPLVPGVQPKQPSFSGNKTGFSKF